ncbi:MAG: hypothetical protein AB2777_16715 [Candidatus Thiodiazotropha endolucinida]
MKLSEEFAIVRSYISKTAGVRFFETHKYPTQLKSKPISDTQYSREKSVYLGELRGFYPLYDPKATDAESIELGYFQPWNSAYHPKKSRVNNDIHRRHRGVDVYAPFFPFPFEVPVFALVGGRMLARTLYQHTSHKHFEVVKENGKRTVTRRRQFQELGDRVRIIFEVPIGKQKHKYFLDYGHLSRFAGSDRNRRDIPQQRMVEAGELLGFVGKSGNADFKTGNSSRKSLYKINAGHIHVSVWRLGSFIDPLDVLPKPLAYDPRIENDLGYEKPRKEYYFRPTRKEWGGVAPRDEFEQPITPTESTLIGVDMSPPMRRVVIEKKRPKRRRALYPKPFHFIDVDSTKTLKTTYDSYIWAAKRLERATGDQSAKHIVSKQHLDDAIIKFRDLLSIDPVHKDKEYWGDNVGALLYRARDVLQGVDSCTEGKACRGAAIARALLHFKEALWIVMGGPALQALTRSKEQVECGIGVRGHLFATAWPKAVAALHISTPNATSKSALSITFGAGGLRHATATVLAYEQAEGKVQKLIGRLIGSLLRLMMVHRLAFRLNERHSKGEMTSFRNFWADQPEVWPIDNSKPANELYADIYRLAEELVVVDDTTIQAFLRALIDGNVTAFYEAIKISKEHEINEAIAPALVGLYRSDESTS